MSKLGTFLDTFSSNSTKTAYKWAFKLFFKSVYGKRANDEKELEGQVERYFAEKRDHQKDLTKFFSEIKGRPPKSVSLALSAIKTFLTENNIEIPESFWRRLRGRRKGSRALTIDRVPTNLELRKILEHMTILGKALFLFLASSGMRIGETLKLNVHDIQLDTDPARVSISGKHTKSGNSRIAFISSETKDALEEWFKVRADYIKSAVAKSHLYKKSRNDGRLFPFATSTAHLIWRNALRKAELLVKDANTERLTFHPHVLRKFFRTRLGAVIPQDVVEALMGWEGQLREVYRKYGVEQLAEFYKQGESSLLVFSNTGEEVSRVRKEFELKSKGVEETLSEIVSEKSDLRKQLDLLKKRVLESESLKGAIDWQVKFVKILHEALPKYISSISGMDEKTKKAVINAWMPVMNLDVNEISRKLNLGLKEMEQEKLHSGKN